MIWAPPPSITPITIMIVPPALWDSMVYAFTLMRCIDEPGFIRVILYTAWACYPYFHYSIHNCSLCLYLLSATALDKKKRPKRAASIYVHVFATQGLGIAWPCVWCMQNTKKKKNVKMTLTIRSNFDSIYITWNNKALFSVHLPFTTKKTSINENFQFYWHWISVMMVASACTM